MPYICDEWAYFRGECKPGGTPAASSTPAAESELASDGWKIYRNETLGYRFDYPTDARIEIADDPLKGTGVHLLPGLTEYGRWHLTWKKTPRKSVFRPMCVGTKDHIIKGVHPTGCKSKTEGR